MTFKNLNDKMNYYSEISKKTGESIANVNTILTMLELEGYIKALPGNNFKAKE